MVDKFVWNEFEHRVAMAPKGWNSWMSGIAGQTRQNLSGLNLDGTAARRVSYREVANQICCNG